MINIVDYVSLCSDALLNSIDEIYELNKKSDNLYIDFSNKKIQEIFKFYLNSQLNYKHQYGYFNIVVQSCEPNNNWRENDMNKCLLYQIMDDSIKVDTYDMSSFLNNCFIHGLNDNTNRFIYFYRNNIDIYDYLSILEQMFGNYKLNKNNLSIIENGNKNISHDDDIESYIRQDIEKSLLSLNLNKQ